MAALPSQGPGDGDVDDEMLGGPVGSSDDDCWDSRPPTPVAVIWDASDDDNDAAQHLQQSPFVSWAGREHEGAPSEPHLQREMAWVQLGSRAAELQEEYDAVQLVQSSIVGISDGMESFFSKTDHAVYVSGGEPVGRPATADRRQPAFGTDTGRG